MQRIRSLVGVGVCIASLALVFACGGGEDGGAVAEARDAEWSALEAEHASLTEARAEIVALRIQLLEIGMPPMASTEPEEEATEPEEPTEGEIPEGEAPGEEAMTPEAIQARIDALDTEITNKSEEFGQHLVDFINADPVYQGEEPSESQKAAFRLKSGEDIILAQEYIDRGGDYRRAIEIFEGALMIDPENQDLVAALEKAKAERFMTEERFSQASKGMGEDQIRALLGQVYHHNVRDYPEKEVVAWFYPKEEGGAAGVYFKLHKKSETYQVYRVDFNAVKLPTEEGGEEEEPAVP